jgi:hypothetical protein
MDDRTRRLAELLAHDTLEATRSRLEAVADAIERLARGPKQRALAAEFTDFVSDYVRQPLSTADLNGLIGLGHWLDVYAEKFEQLGGRAEFREAVGWLEALRKDCISAHDEWCRSGAPDVQYPTLTKEAAEELLRDIEKLTSRQFVYEDGWCGMVPAGDALTELQTGPPERFADLHWRDQADILRSFIDWDRYSEQGLDWRDRDAIQRNVRDGQPPERWLEGTSFLETSEQFGQPKPQPSSLADQFQDMLGGPAGSARQNPAKDDVPGLLETLQAAEQHCMEGLDCAEADHMEGALQDALTKVRAAITQVRAARPTPEPKRGKDTGIER